MKKKMSRNDVYELAGKRQILKVPYCAARYILRHLEPVGYNEGLHGWNYDVYDCGRIVVVTGQRMMIRGVKAESKWCNYFSAEALEMEDDESILNYAYQDELNNPWTWKYLMQAIFELSDNR